MIAPAATGRPLRALWLLALLLGCWLMWRLPALEQEIARTRFALAPGAPTLLAASFEPGDDRAEADAADWPAAPTVVALGTGPPAPAPVPVIYMLPPGAAPPAAPVAERSFAAPLPRPIAYDAAPGWSLFPRATTAPSPTRRGDAAPVPLPATPAHALASAAYARLAAGDRREAVRLFDAALAAGPDSRADQWRADRRRLTRRWSGEAYSLLRAPSVGGSGPAATPVLGGAQSGGSLAWTWDPLARRPVAIVARINTAGSGGGGSAQAAVGVRWQVAPWLNLSAERLIAIGEGGRDDWTVRIAGGKSGSWAVRGRRVAWSGYGEAGAIGNGDLFAGGQARAGVTVLDVGKLTLLAGPGAWGSIQTGGTTVARFDLGPTLATRLPFGRGSFEVAADYRFRVAGNAQPGSGPALTVSTSF